MEIDYRTCAKTFVNILPASAYRAGLFPVLPKKFSQKQQLSYLAFAKFKRKPGLISIRVTYKNCVAAFSRFFKGTNNIL